MSIAFKNQDCCIKYVFLNNEILPFVSKKSHTGSLINHTTRHIELCFMSACGDSQEIHCYSNLRNEYMFLQDTFETAQTADKCVTGNGNVMGSVVHI